MAAQLNVLACGVAVMPLLLLLAEQVQAEAEVPRWPTSYQVSFKLKVPYINRLQKGGLTYKYKFWRDEANGRQKMQRDNSEFTYIDLTENMRYDIFPAKDRWLCWMMKLGGKSGPTLAEQPPTYAAPASADNEADVSTSEQQVEEGLTGAADVRRRRLLGSGEGASLDDTPSRFSPEEIKKLGFVLPDLTEKRWQRNGMENVEGRELMRFTYMLSEDRGYGEVSGQYDFLVDESGAPAELHMWGINLLTGGHFDDYRIQYYDYDAHTIPDDVFAFDKAKCVFDLAEQGEPGMPDSGVPFHLPGSAAAHAASVLPSVHHGDPEYDAFMHKSGRRHASQEQYDGRRDTYHDNKQLVEACNAANRTYTCALNRFADWTREERRRLYRAMPGQTSLANLSTSLGPNLERKRKSDYRHMRPHKPLLPPHFVPATADWRGSPADSPVKDQAACGSCWTFSTIASLEAAYYRATGKALLLSEQHVLNCDWADTPQKGCFGGGQDLALDWAFDNGFIASEASLPYTGVNDFCPKHADGVRFKGHWSIVTPGEEAVKEAVATRGPLTVSIDASHPDMAFYKSGIYHNPDCQDTADGLDHAVILSGYGQDEEGHPYWIVKNTWSTNWGEEGYVRVSRRPEDCGIASEAMYAVYESVEEVKGEKLA